MVHVRVRDEHELDLRRRDGDVDVLKLVAPLLHAAVDQAVMPADLEQGAAAGHLVVGADKCQLHGLTPFRYCYLILARLHAARNRSAKKRLPRRGKNVPPGQRPVMRSAAARAPRGSAA